MANWGLWKCCTQYDFVMVFLRPNRKIPVQFTTWPTQDWWIPYSPVPYGIYSTTVWCFNFFLTSTKMESVADIVFAFLHSTSLLKIFRFFFILNWYSSSRNVANTEHRQQKKENCNFETVSHVYKWNMRTIDPILCYSVRTKIKMCHLPLSPQPTTRVLTKWANTTDPVVYFAWAELSSRVQNFCSPSPGKVKGVLCSPSMHFAHAKQLCLYTMLYQFTMKRYWCQTHFVTKQCFPVLSWNSKTTLSKIFPHQKLP